MFKTLTKHQRCRLDDEGTIVLEVEKNYRYHQNIEYIPYQVRWKDYHEFRPLNLHLYSGYYTDINSRVGLDNVVYSKYMKEGTASKPFKYAYMDLFIKFMCDLAKKSNKDTLVLSSSINMFPELAAENGFDLYRNNALTMEAKILYRAIKKFA